MSTRALVTLLLTWPAIAAPPATTDLPEDDAPPTTTEGASTSDTDEGQADEGTTGPSEPDASGVVPVHAPDRVRPPPLGALPDPVVEAAREAASLPLGERMKRISDAWMGRPYVLDPLGEGQGVDADPLARYDGFDCLTFVEEVLALSLAGDPVHAAPVRLSLRYGERTPTYAHRRHFMELQWIPGNLEAGWLRDTTAEYGPVIRLDKEVSLDTWGRWSARPGFALTDDELPTGRMKLDVLSIDDAIAAAPRIRPGTLVLTVRQDRSWKPIWISHVGFVIPDPDEPTVRHATKLVPAGVRDHGLIYYLDKLRTYTRWPVVGVSLLEPIEQGPRVSRLTGD